MARCSSAALAFLLFAAHGAPPSPRRLGRRNPFELEAAQEAAGKEKMEDARRDAAPTWIDARPAALPPCAAPDAGCWPGRVALDFGRVFNGTDFAFEARLLRNASYADNQIEVIAASPGAWAPTDSCPTPRLWVLIYGQYRSFDSTQRNLAKLAALGGAGSCFFVAAVTADDAGYRPGGGDVDVAAKLRAAQAKTFGGAMAFTVCRRRGAYDRATSLQGTLDFFWWGGAQFLES